jgi:hypothetical protein
MVYELELNTGVMKEKKKERTTIVILGRWRQEDHGPRSVGQS